MGNFVEQLSNLLAGAIVEKPETFHRRIINHGIILPHAHIEHLDAAPQIDKFGAVGHSMIAENVQPHFGIMLPGNLQDGLKPFFINEQLAGNFRRLITDTMKQPIQFRPIHEPEIDFLRANIRDERGSVFRFGPGWFADVMRYFALREEIEDVGAAIHPAGFERALWIQQGQRGCYPC